MRSLATERGWRRTSHLAAAAVLWSGARAAAQPASGAPATPEPPRERAWFEVEGHAGISVPVGEVDAVDIGPTVGGLVLVRPHPRWALGIAGDYTTYAWNAVSHSSGPGEPGFHEPDARLYSGFVGGAARHYFFDRGWLDVHVQLAVGYAVLEHSASVESYCCHTSALVGLQAAVGFDIYATHWLRLTGSAAFTYDVFRQSALLIALPDDPPAPPLVSPGLGIRWGVTFGAP